MSHPHPRTERDLRWLAESFSAGRITRGLPERLECLAAWHRLALEAKAGNELSDHAAAYVAACERLRAAGVDPSEGEFTFSPCCGPDRT